MTISHTKKTTISSTRHLLTNALLGALLLSTSTHFAHAEDIKVPSARISETKHFTPLQITPAKLNSDGSLEVDYSQLQQYQKPQPITGSVQHIEYNTEQLQNDPLLDAPDITVARFAGIPTPSVYVSNISYVPTILIPQTQSSTLEQLDVSLLDSFINEISPNARHYPPNFPNRTEQYTAKEKLKELEEWLRPYAETSNASYDILIRAAKLNGMARNLDLGTDYAVRASTYIAKAIDRDKNSAEANFLYGMFLSEGGGFKEGKKYLDKAASLGYKEAEQSLAQVELLTDNRPKAIEILQRLQMQYPNDEIIAQQLHMAQNGEFHIWNLPIKR